jgi:outer membrane usher protein
MSVTLRPKYWLRIDVHQAGIVAHKINAKKSLNARLLLLTMLTLTPSAALAEDTALAVDEVFLVVVINQQEQGVAFLLRSDDRLFAGGQDLRRWRLHLPNTTPLNRDGEDFYALDTLAGLSYEFNEASQALTVQAPPNLFDATRLKGTVTNFSAPTPASPGGFLNYDVSANHAQERTSTSGLLELGGVRSKRVCWRGTSTEERPPSGWIPPGREISR